MAKKIELDADQQAIWNDLCDSVGVDPIWLKHSLNQYYDLAEQYGIMEIDEEMLKAKNNFGWIEYAVRWMDAE